MRAHLSSGSFLPLFSFFAGIVYVDELLDMVEKGEVDVDKVRDETLEYQLYGPQDVSY